MSGPRKHKGGLGEVELAVKNGANLAKETGKKFLNAVKDFVNKGIHKENRKNQEMVIDMKKSGQTASPVSDKQTTNPPPAGPKKPGMS